MKGFCKQSLLITKLGCTYDESTNVTHLVKSFRDYWFQFVSVQVRKSLTLKKKNIAYGINEQKVKKLNMLAILFKTINHHEYKHN